jgi:hypothetical protein
MKENETEYTRNLLGNEEDIIRTQEVSIYPLLLPGSKDEYTYFYGIGIANVNHYVEENTCKHDMIENWEILRASGTIALYDGD